MTLLAVSTRNMLLSAGCQKLGFVDFQIQLDCFALFVATSVKGEPGTINQSVPQPNIA